MLDPSGFAALTGSTIAESRRALRVFWDDLPPDTYLRDGGHYRRRRHSCFIVGRGEVEQVPHRAHWQPVEYNALHGGLERWFEPIEPAVIASPAWLKLLKAMAALASSLRKGGEQPWYVEAHQFRIDTTDGIGRPTPEGAHRDGVDLVAVVLVGREGIKGGETRVFDADGPTGLRFTMREPWTTLVLDDARHPREHADPAARGLRPPRYAGADVARGRLPGPGGRCLPGKISSTVRTPPSFTSTGSGPAPPNRWLARGSQPGRRRAPEFFDEPREKARSGGCLRRATARCTPCRPLHRAQHQRGRYGFPNGLHYVITSSCTPLARQDP